VCLSKRARELLQRTPSLQVRRGRLRPSVTREASRYAEALAATVRLAEPRRGAKSEPLEVPPMVSISRPEQRPLGLLMLPLMPRHGLRAKTTSSARVLMVMHDPDALTRLDPRALQALHGLTATEAQLAVALTEGKTLGDFARARGGSEQTARVHLKRILDKTQTRRQSDLVRVLLSSGVLQVRGVK
jgi:DNA-binding CsgD family transcriptional regulator